MKNLDHLIEARDIVQDLVFALRQPNKFTFTKTADWLYKHPERLLELIEGQIMAELQDHEYKEAAGL